MRTRVLVTGADGFIGSHLVEALVRSGYRVRAFCCYNAFNSWGWLDGSAREILDRIEVVTGDLRDPFGVKAAARGCEVILHLLGALIAIPFSYHSPQSYLETNVGGTLNVLQAARELGVRRVIHTSTSEVYGSARFVPITEDHPLQAQSPYSASKIAADAMAVSFHAAFDQDVVICRPFNPYGPRQSARAVIPTILTQILAGQDTIRLGSLSPTRDFNFVADTVRAFMSLIDADDRVGGEAINFGSDYEISIGDAVRVIAEACEREVRIVCDEARLRPERSEVDRLHASNAKARALTGWRPGYAGLDGFRRGIAETVAWFKEPANLARYKAEIYAI